VPRALAITVLVALVGCADADGLELRRWRLDGAREVTLPGRADGVPERGSYELSARIDVPAAWRGAPLTLAVSDVPAIVRLDVDGTRVLATDAPDPGAYRQRGPLRWAIPADATADGVLELRFVVENLWTQSTWWNGAPTLVAGDALPSDAQAVVICNLYLALAALISLAQISLTSLIVYLADRRRRAYLWFGLQTAAAAYLPLFVLGATQRVLGVYDAPVLAIALVVAVLASIYFTHEFFELPPPWRGWGMIAWAAIVVIAIANDPFRATPVSGPVTVIVISTLTIYQLVVCARLARQHPDRGSARTLFASWVALSVMIPPDLIYWLGAIDDPLRGARLAPLGLLGFGVCLSLLLGRRHLTSLRLEAEHLTRSRAEVEQLNVELRRQVAERSNQLFTALAIVGGRAARAPELRVGEPVHGRYRVVGERGRGGMGTVYEVERLGDGRRLALKLTHEVTGPAMARLAREALIASRVDHPNLVGVVDVDVTAGFLYVVMELVDGTSLKALRDRHGDAAWALPLLAQIAAGLAALHRSGVVHRDLKPGNLLLTEGAGGRPLVKITDFGVSRHLPGEWESSGGDEAVDAEEPIDDDGETVTMGDGTAETRNVRPPRRRRPSAGGLTRTGMLVGTPAYIAPELVDGPQALSAAADLFAFGVLAWDLIAGERPFPRPVAFDRMHGVELTQAPSLAARWSGPPEVVGLFDRCLAIDPASRPTADEAAAILQRYLR
jgi:serine/threonine-protein kinase